jgi:hypothetical protein
VVPESARLDDFLLFQATVESYALRNTLYNNYR